MLKSPLSLKNILPPALLTISSIPSKIDVALGNSSFEWLLPCHERVQPPVAFVILCAPSPITRIFFDGSIGKVWLLFFKSTKDSLTALLAIFLFSGRANLDSSPAFNLELGRPFSKIPEAIFTLRILLTASSNLSIDIVPSLTCFRVLSYNPFQLSGAIYISKPAFKD